MSKGKHSKRERARRARQRVRLAVVPAEPGKDPACTCSRGGRDPDCPAPIHASAERLESLQALADEIRAVSGETPTQLIDANGDLWVWLTELQGGPAPDLATRKGRYVNRGPFLLS